MSADTPCCPIGRRHDVADIDAAVRQVGQPGALSLSALAARVGVNKGSLHRHRGHLGEAPTEPVAPPLQNVRNEPATTTQQDVTASKSPPSPFAVSNPGDDPATAPRKVISATIEREAVRQRARGLSYERIGESLGIHPETAMDAVERVLLRTRRGADDQADAARRLDLERIDQLLAGLWDRATNPAMASVEVPADTETGVRAYDGQDKACDRVVKLLERRAKLMGLDAPSGPTINIFAAPDWVRLRDAILGALASHPQALADVVAAIARVQRGGGGGEGEHAALAA